MKVIYDKEKNRFSIIDLTGGEAGSLAGALEFAVDQKRRLGMYEKTREEGGIEIVEDISKQLLRADFMNSY